MLSLEIIRMAWKSLGANKIATGHYARMLPGPGGPELHKGIDPDKDQSYVLHGIAREVLPHLIFPIGDYAKPTIRELYREVAGMGGFCLIGTPSNIADVMQDWFENDACDGFNITPTHLPGGCEDFVDLVIPELQRRGLFRSEYEGRTLRENLGLPRPPNRFFQDGSSSRS